MATPIPRIEMAVDGMLDRIAGRDPFGPPVAPPPAEVAASLAAVLRGRKKQASAARRRK